MATYKEFHARSISDPEGFWGAEAAMIDWHRPFDKVLSYDKPPFRQWFAGGLTNLCHNAIDRHLAARGTQKALVWISTEVNEEKSWTVAELHDDIRIGAYEIEIARLRRAQRVRVVSWRFIVAIEPGDCKEPRVRERRLREPQSFPECAVIIIWPDLEHRARRALGQFHADRIARGDDRIPSVTRHTGAIELLRDRPAWFRHVGEQDHALARRAQALQRRAGSGVGAAAVVHDAPHIAEHGIVLR